jgi:hypothetical protein
MKRGAVPKRILTVREFREYSPWDTPRYRVVDAVRVLRAWLADPSVPDELGVGDALEAARSGKGQTRY